MWEHFQQIALPSERSFQTFWGLWMGLAEIMTWSIVTENATEVEKWKQKNEISSRKSESAVLAIHEYEMHCSYFKKECKNYLLNLEWLHNWDDCVDIHKSYVLFIRPLMRWNSIIECDWRYQ